MRYLAKLFVFLHKQIDVYISKTVKSCIVNTQFSARYVLGATFLGGYWAH